jgi:hypothetical protein
MLVAQGWVGQHRISQPDPEFNGSPHIVFDHSGTPWAGWTYLYHDSSPAYSTWLGDSWAFQRKILPNDTGMRGRAGIILSVDDLGRVWICWSTFNNDGMDYDGTNYWEGGHWSPPSRATPESLTDTLTYGGGKWFACGGGAVWYTFSGAKALGSETCTVFASRWDEAQQKWGPLMQVSQPDGGFYWCNSIVVDSSGRPHVFYVDAGRLRVWHSFYDGTRWSVPEPVNDTERTTASPEAFPLASVDADGVIHVTYTGAPIGAPYRSIMYTYDDGAGWRPSMRATQGSKDSLYPPWYAAVAAARRNDVWAVWMRQGEGPDQFRVYASHFDGDTWSPEVRVDDHSHDSSYNNGDPEIALDPQNNPWVVWDGIDPNMNNFASYYNRLGDVGVAESHEPSRAAPTLQVACERTGAAIRYRVNEPCLYTLAILDLTGRRIAALAGGRAEPGLRVIHWNYVAGDGQSVPSGVYFIRLSAGNETVTRKIAVVTNQTEWR